MSEHKENRLIKKHLDWDAYYALQPELLKKRHPDKFAQIEKKLSESIPPERVTAYEEMGRNLTKFEHTTEDSKVHRGSIFRRLSGDFRQVAFAAMLLVVGMMVGWFVKSVTLGTVNPRISFKAVENGYVIVNEQGMELGQIQLTVKSVEINAIERTAAVTAPNTVTKIILAPSEPKSDKTVIKQTVPPHKKVLEVTSSEGKKR